MGKTVGFSCYPGSTASGQIDAPILATTLVSRFWFREVNLTRSRTIIVPTSRFAEDYRSTSHTGRWIWGCLALLMVCLFAVPPGIAADRTLRVVYTEWFPYTFQDNQAASGFEIDTFKEVIKSMNIQAEFTSYPWKRCLNSLQSGEADIVISLLKTPEREEYTYFPEEHISISRTMFFTTLKKEVKYTGSIDELKGYQIGVIMGFSYGEAFDKATNLKKDEAVDARTLINKLLKGWIDLGAENQAVISASATKMGVRDQIRFIDPPIHTQKLYVGFGKAKSPKKLCDDFSKSLAAFKKTEAYRAILSKYGVNPSEMTAD